MEMNESDRAMIDEIIAKIRAKGREPVVFLCGPAPKPEDHKCDLKGPRVDIPHGNGVVVSASCSKCGRAAFDSRSIWD